MSRKGKARRGGQGFTLVEVLLVLVILVVIASLAVTAYGPVRKQANVKAARAQIGVFESALGLYQVNVGDYPATDIGLQGLREAPSDLDDPDKWEGPYLSKAIPNDPWGQPYQYEYPGTHDETMPDIWSMGPDMVDGTEDDVGNWSEESER
ncbi:MAG: type II secretion system major pseudopilin GspG [Thermoguttaceae bacterium]